MGALFLQIVIFFTVFNPVSPTQTQDLIPPDKKQTAVLRISNFIHSLQQCYFCGYPIDFFFFRQSLDK
jgi:hypothetical protein